MAAIHAADNNSLRKLTSAYLMRLACLATASVVHVDPLPASNPTIQRGQEVAQQKELLL